MIPAALRSKPITSLLILVGKSRKMNGFESRITMAVSGDRISTPLIDSPRKRKNPVTVFWHHNPSSMNKIKHYNHIFVAMFFIERLSMVISVNHCFWHVFIPYWKKNYSGYLTRASIRECQHHPRVLYRRLFWQHNQNRDR